MFISSHFHFVGMRKTSNYISYSKVRLDIRGVYGLDFGFFGTWTPAASSRIRSEFFPVSGPD